MPLDTKMTPVDSLSPLKRDKISVGTLNRSAEAVWPSIRITTPHFDNSKYFMSENMSRCIYLLRMFECPRVFEFEISREELPVSIPMDSNELKMHESLFVFRMTACNGVICTVQNRNVRLIGRAKKKCGISTKVLQNKVYQSSRIF